MVFNGENKSVFGTIKSEDAALWVRTSTVSSRFQLFKTRKCTCKTQKFEKVIDIYHTKIPNQNCVVVHKAS